MYGEIIKMSSVGCDDENQGIIQVPEKIGNRVSFSIIPPDDPNSSA
jgi:hypothetical protein